MDQIKQKEYAYSNEPAEVSDLATPPADPEEAAPPFEAPEAEAPSEVTEAAEVSDPLAPTEGAVPYEATEGEAPLEATEPAAEEPLTEPVEAAEPTEAAASYEAPLDFMEAPETTEPAAPEATEAAAPYEAPLDFMEAPETTEPGAPEATEAAAPYEAPLDFMEAPQTMEPEAAEAQAPHEAAEGEAPLEDPEATELTEPLGAPEVTQIAEPVEAPEAVASRETAETASRSRPTRSPLTSTAPPPSFDGPSASERFGEFLQFLDRTKRVWVFLASAIFVLLVVGLAARRVSEWTKVPQAAPQSAMATTITPEVLTTHCGPPAADVTTQMYPLLTRTMTYETSGNQSYVFSFSRTAEKNSEWVFLSMKDLSGANSYDSPEAEVAAMSCLDSRK
jgi:hypothetical protein